MNFKEMLLEVLLEGKIEDTLDRHPTIPDDVKQNYLKQIPAQNAQHLDWVLSQHTKGNIKPEHDINGILSTFNKVKDKLPKKQIHQYGSMNELHTAIVPHQNNVKMSDNEKSKDGTETLYSSPTMTITQHHNYESTVGAANLPENNVSKRDKAGWCVSVGDGGGAGHYSTYTSNGFHPVYTIEHKHEDGTSSKHMLVYDHNKTQDKQELRDENDKRPGFNDYSSTRPDLLDHYGTEHPELKKTPIAHLFNETGREQYKSDTEPAHKKLLSIIRTMGNYEIPDDEYMDYFNAGLEKRQGGIHDELAKSQLSPTQLTHLIEHGNQGCKHDIAKRNDLSEEHMQKLANTSNMLVHHHLLQKPDLPIATFNTIVKKAHAETIPKVIAHPKFNETHINTLLNKKMSNVNLTPIINRFHDKLESPHIKSLIDKGDANVHSDLINKLSDKLEQHHIKSLIDKGDANVHSDLINKLSADKLEPHIQSLIDKGYSNVHSDLINKLSDKLEPKHIKELIDKGDSNTHLLLSSTHYDKLKPEHIQSLMNNGDIATKEALKVNEDPHHIQSLVDKGDTDYNYFLSHIFSHKLEPHHISTLIDKGDTDVNLSLINKLSVDKLEPHIQSLIDKGDGRVHSNLINKLSDKLKPHHIKELIDKDNSNVHSTLIDALSTDKLEPHIKSLIDKDNANMHLDLINKLKDKLKPHHIKELIDKGDSSVHSNLINTLSTDKLEPHLSTLIDKGDSSVHSNLINKLKDKLKPHHIKELIDKGDSSVHSNLINTLSTDKLEPHLSTLIDKGDSSVHSSLINKLSIDKLEPHLSKLITKGNSSVHSQLIRKLDGEKINPHFNTLSDKLAPHITTLIANSDHNNKHKLINEVPDILKPEHISALIDKGDSSVHSSLINKLKDKLEPKHITEMINKNKDIHHNIINALSGKLEPKHITEMINKNKDIHHNIINALSGKLETEHISALIDKGDSDIHTRLINMLSDKLEPKHINALIDKGDSSVHSSLINKLSIDKLEPHLSKLITKGNKHVHTNLINKLKDKLEPHHIKAIMDKTPYSINAAYNTLSDESKKVVLTHVQSMKDSGNDKWAEFHNVHKDMVLSDVDKVKKDINSSYDDIMVSTVNHNLSDDELKTHIHPIIDNEIEDAKGNHRKSANALVRFGTMMNKDQANKAVSSIKRDNNINFHHYGNKMNNHVRDAIFDHAIKTGNHELLTHTIRNGGINKYDISHHHLEHIISNHPELMHEIDYKGTYAKQVASTAIKNNDTKTIDEYRNSNNIKYRSAVLDHTLDTDNTRAVLEHLQSSRENIPHDDLNKILFHQHSKGYNDRYSGEIIRNISYIRNLHSGHIDHIIKSGNEKAIKNMISGGYNVPRQNLTTTHKNAIIALKNKELSSSLKSSEFGLTPVQNFNNGRVLREWYFTNNNFERLLKESLIGK